jgi:hypothetical protein
MFATSTLQQCMQHVEQYSHSGSTIHLCDLTHCYALLLCMVATQLLGGDFQSKLREAFDPAQLPVYLGGTRTDPEFA